MTKPASEEHTGIAIMAKLSYQDAYNLVVPGGEALNDLHVTLSYLKQEPKDVNPFTRAWLNTNLRSQVAMPLYGNIYARAEFNYNNSADSERPPCAVYLVQSQSLKDAHDQVLRQLNIVTGVDDAGTFPLWNPHITIGYGLDLSKLRAPTGVVTFDKLVISYAGQTIDITGSLT